MSSDDAAGHWLSGPDNDSFMYRGADAPACPDCLLVTDHEWVNPEFVPKRKELDYASTFDGATIVSRRFAEFAGGEPGVRFLTLPAASDFAVLQVDAIVQVDTDRRGTRFQDECPGCGRFRQIAGATPVFVRDGCEVPAGFSRSDQRYGSAADEGQHRRVAQHAVVMVDLELGRRLDGEHFKGLELHAIAR